MKLVFAVMVLFAGAVLSHEHRGLHRRKQQNKNFYQHIDGEQKQIPEELAVYENEQPQVPFPSAEEHQPTDDVMRFRTKIDRHYNGKEYDSKSSRRNWRCKHRGDTGTKAVHSSKYGYSKRYWKCKYGRNETADSPDWQEYEPESLLDDIMDSIANP